MRKFLVFAIPLILLFLARNALTQEPATEEVASVLEAFDQTQEILQEEILTESLAEVWVESASTLALWKGYSDFLALAQRTLEPAYAAYRRKDLVAELDRRLPVVQGSADWAASFDTGLMAMVAGRYIEAVTCFTEASLDPENADNPYTQAYLGRAFFKLRIPDLAILAYEDAIDSASTEPPTRFQLNFMYAMDLYDHDQMHVALGEDGPIQGCLQSEYPLEKCFGLYEILLHAWGEGDEVLIAQSANQLAIAIPSATPDQNSQYEQRRFAQASELLARVQAAQQGDDVARMILDEEACDFDFKTNRFDTARARLKPWSEEYPLSTYDSLDGELRDAVTWVQLNYSVAEVLAGSPTVAESGLETYINEVPFEDFPRKVVEAWLWLGYSRHRLRDLWNAKTAYETGLSLDAVDSPIFEMEATSDDIDSATAESRFTIDNLQPRILGGKTRWQIREDFVREYHDLLLTLKAMESEQ